MARTEGGKRGPPGPGAARAGARHAVRRSRGTGEGSGQSAPSGTAAEPPPRSQHRPQAALYSDSGPVVADWAGAEVPVARAPRSELSSKSSTAPHRTQPSRRAGPALRAWPRAGTAAPQCAGWDRRSPWEGFPHARGCLAGARHKPARQSEADAIGTVKGGSGLAAAGGGGAPEMGARTEALVAACPACRPGRGESGARCLSQRPGSPWLHSWECRQRPAGGRPEASLSGRHEPGEREPWGCDLVSGLSGKGRSCRQETPADERREQCREARWRLPARNVCQSAYI